MKGGFSGCRGIIIYDSSLEGDNSVYGYYEGDEMVLLKGDYKELKKLRQEHEDANQKDDTAHDKLIWGLMAALLALVVATFLTQRFLVCLAVLVFAVAIYFPVIVLCFANMNSYMDEETHQQFRRFHGCEHAMMKIYLKGGEVTMDNLRTKSIYDSECGTVYSGYAIVLATVVAVVIANIMTLGFFKGLGIVLGTVVLLFVIILLPASPFMLLQRPAVAKPTDREYELGLAILKKIKEEE